MLFFFPDKEITVVPWNMRESVSFLCLSPNASRLLLFNMLVPILLFQGALEGLSVLSVWEVFFFFFSRCSALELTCVPCKLRDLEKYIKHNYTLFFLLTHGNITFCNGVCKSKFDFILYNLSPRLLVICSYRLWYMSIRRQLKINKVKSFLIRT